MGKKGTSREREYIEKRDFIVEQIARGRELKERSGVIYQIVGSHFDEYAQSDVAKHKRYIERICVEGFISISKDSKTLSLTEKGVALREMNKRAY